MMSSPNPVTTCRQGCNDAGRALALVRNNAECRCADVAPDDVTPPIACSSGDWYAYRVHRAISQHALNLRAWSQMRTGRDYTKPGEDVAFYASHDLGLDSTFTFTFDDGTTLVTSSSPVYHAFQTAGVHAVTVTTRVGVIELNATASVEIEDVDEGTEPELVAVTSWHEEKARVARYSVFVADEHSTNCTLRYGDGTSLVLATFSDFGETRQTDYRYGVCGGYHVVAECNNTYGRTADSEFFLAREMDTFSSYLPLGKDFNISVAGGINFLEVIIIIIVITITTTTITIIAVISIGDSGRVVNSLDFCQASLKSLGCFYFRCVLSSQWKAVTVNLQILHCQP